MEETVLRAVQKSEMPSKPMDIVTQVASNLYTEDARRASAAIRSLVEQGELDVTVDLKLQARK